MLAKAEKSNKFFAILWEVAPFHLYNIELIGFVAKVASDEKNLQWKLQSLFIQSLKWQEKEKLESETNFDEELRQQDWVSCYDKGIFTFGVTNIEKVIFLVAYTFYWNYNWLKWRKSFIEEDCLKRLIEWGAITARWRYWSRMKS